MKHLVIYKFGFKIIGPIEDERRLREAASFFRRQGFKVFVTLPPPPANLLETWEVSGCGQASDGCLAFGLSSCKHGHRSWLAIHKGLIK